MQTNIFFVFKFALFKFEKMRLDAILRLIKGNINV